MELIPIEQKNQIMNPVSRKKREQRSAGGSIRNFGGPIGYVAPKSPLFLMNNNQVYSYYSFTNNSPSATILPFNPGLRINTWSYELGVSLICYSTLPKHTKMRDLHANHQIKSDQSPTEELLTRGIHTSTVNPNGR
jgi:hypothetical protein